MNWNQLQYVITIAQEKSITKAAKKLFISQPSLTLSIQSLEKETGILLFERKRGEMILTYGGQLFYEWAVSTLRSNQQLKLKLNDISEKTRHLIRIGISPHRSCIMLPDILRRFYNDYPNCEIHIMEKPTFLLKKLLEEHEIDLLIDVAHPDTISYQSDVLLKEEILLAVPETLAPPLQEADALSPTSSILLEEFSTLPFLMLSEDHVLGSMSRKMCEAAAFHPDIRLICSNIETALALVNKQLGITFVPEIFAKQKRFHPNVRYYSIRQFHDARQVCLIYHKNMYRHTALSALIRIFQETTPALYN
ncbi:MAG: LysR family transcriptional regulator [Eubacteriales bacterium]|nr:LysR family transcriptional regulator [Eubacteriales bacterium]